MTVNRSFLKSESKFKSFYDTIKRAIYNKMPETTRIWGKTDEHGASPNLIIIEILEGLALQDVDKINEKIEQLHQKGFRISMDDFGSGFSSLNTLGKLKIDELKLDRGFLQDISGQNYERAELVMEQVIHMARKLHISTVVEGVETAENEQLIKTMGSDYEQGYYYRKPIPADDFHKTYMVRPNNQPKWFFKDLNNSIVQVFKKEFNKNSSWFFISSMIEWYCFPGVAQIGSALPWGGRGRGFKSRHSDHDGVTKKMSLHFFSIHAGLRAFGSKIRKTVLP